MKKRFLVLLGIGALCLGAAAKEINNFLKDGFPVLIPSVQKLERTEKGFTLPSDLAVAAPEEAKYEAGLVGPMISNRFGGYKAHVVGANEPAKFRLVLTDAGVPDSPEGYTLAISPAGIEIKARDVRGLYYGVQTFGDIVSRNIVTTLPGCRIADWPDLKIRGAFLNIRRLKNKDVKAFANVIRVFGGLKYNTLVLEFADNLPMQDNPFTLRKETLTQESLDTILAAAKRNHIEIIPHLQVLSHDDWMRMHPEHKEKISARKEGTSSRTWDSSACPEKPLTRKLIDYTINETIRLLKPKRFHLGMDEFILCEWNKCNMCPDGHNTAQLVREVKHYTELVDKQGVIPFVYHDTFCGKDPSGGEAALPHLPKSVVFNMWSYRAEPTVEYFDFFQDKGFKTVGVSYVHVPDNIPAIARAAKKYQTEGAILTYWGYLGDNFLSANGIDTLSASGTVTAAEYQWKTSGPSLHALDYDPAWELRRRLKYGGVPLRRPKSGYAPIPISNLCNAKLGADRNFPILSADKVAKIAAELAKTPEGFKLTVTPDGKIAAAVLSGGKRDDYPTGKITIPVNGQIAGLSFLMTATRPCHEAGVADKYRYFPEAAVLKINYADGKSRRVPVRYNMEINDWNSLTSGLGCRFVIRGNDDNGSLYSLYSFDWNNPDRKKKVASVEFSSARKNGVAPALLDVVAFLPQDIAPGETKAPADLKEYGSGQVRRDVKWITAVDFTRGMNKTRISTEGQYRAKLRHAIVSDPASPSGKALQIVMAPPVAGVKNPRLIVDVPAPKLEKLGSVRFSVRTDKPELVSRTGVYFMNFNTVKHNVLFNFVNRKTDKWQSFEFPFYMLKAPGKGRDVTAEDFRTVRITAWMKNDYKEKITFRVGPVEVSNEEVDYIPPLRTFKAE